MWLSYGGGQTHNLHGWSSVAEFLFCFLILRQDPNEGDEGQKDVSVKLL